MNHCIAVPAAEIRLVTAPARVVTVHVWSYTEKHWVAVEDVETGASAAQRVAVFTGRMKADSLIASVKGALRPFFYGVSYG